MAGFKLSVPLRRMAWKHEFGRTFFMGFRLLGRNCQRLLALRLASALVDPACRRRGDDGGLLFHARPHHVLGVHSDHIRRLVDDETILIENKRASRRQGIRAFGLIIGLTINR